MSDPELSESDGEQQDVLTEDVLTRWTKKQLQDWLSGHQKRKSGNKPVLIARILRCVHFGSDDSGSEVSSDSDTDDIDVPTYDSITDWDLLTTEKCPPVREEDITDYFLYAKNPVTGKPKKCKRQLKKSRKFCKENYIYETAISDIPDSPYCYVKAKCEPSMRDFVIVNGQKLDHYPIHVLLVKSTGRVESGYCGCKAGIPGVCSHVGALLFVMSKIHSACTSVLCEWQKPRTVKNRLSPKRLEDIAFVNPEVNKETPLKAYPGVYQAGPCSDPDTFFEDIMKDLGNVNPSCVLFQTLNRETTDISDVLEQYRPEWNYSDSQELESNVCQSNFIDFANRLRLTDTDVDRVNTATKGQRVNSNWQEVRKLTLTASNFGNICKRRDSTPPDNLIKSIRGYTQPPMTPAIRYGQNKETKARRDYARHHMKTCGNHINIDEQGVILSQTYPFLGASVDGLVSCAKCGKGVVEIKCPYKWRNRTPEDCATERDFCSSVVNGQMKLKLTHNYMYQVMGQMVVLGVQWADFVVWTKRGINVERITFDQDFWQQNMLYKLKVFYSANFLAELFSHRIERGLPLFR